MSRPRLFGLLLALAALAVYLPAVRYGFILYDDGDYVTQNRMVQDGLTLAGTKWAFTTFESANWHPLTWLSLMADCELFGLNAAGSHFINALFHAANTVLVFALWLQLTRRGKTEGDVEPPSDVLWPAVFIAALFALHPLHVESVAWVSERKDVLSAFFGLLALLCYARYATENGWRAGCSYWLALFFFACGLMSKPMLVTLPFVMLLLDYWPLGRWNELALTPTLSPRRGGSYCSAFLARIFSERRQQQESSAKSGVKAAVVQDASDQRESLVIRMRSQLLLEKAPFFLLTAGSCVVTWFAQNTGAVRTLTQVPLVYRLENVPVAIATYLLKLIWPARLAVIYPMPHSIPPAALAGSLAVLVFITVAVWLARKKEPFLIVGWLWFLGMLVPVLGLVKVGDAAMADRYTYLPSIGIFMAVAFGAQAFAQRRALPKLVLPTAAVVVLAALTFVTERQLQFWRNDELLFKHAMEVTTDNVDAVINYGVALENEGHRVEALKQYEQAEVLSSSYLAHVDRGDLLLEMGDTNGALKEFQQAVQLAPHQPVVSAELHDRLGMALAGMGRFSEATNEFFEAMRLNPATNGFCEAMQLNPAAAWPHVLLGRVLAAQNDFTGATNEFAEAVRMNPGNPAPLVEWGKVLLGHGLNAAALEKFDEALQLDPNNFQTMTFVARLLASDEDAQVRDGATALTLARQADALTDGTQPLVKDALGMAYAETGQFDEAQKAANDAIRLATAAGMKSETIAGMKERLALYAKHQPWRESFVTSKVAK